MKLVVATRSTHKLHEIREILAPVEGLEVLSLDDAGVEEDPDAEAGLEPFDTFEENAMSKARYFAGKTGLPTAADDSGLAVDALGGRPGVHSKRWAPDTGDLSGRELDEANNLHLLREMAEVPLHERTARYVCVIAYVAADGSEHTLRGECEGRIQTGPQGTEGFGYDPLFFVPEYQTTFGIVPPPQKHRVSHRGKAFRAFRDLLRGSGVA